jgi:hypothetical protein
MTGIDEEKIPAKRQKSDSPRAASTFADDLALFRELEPERTHHDNTSVTRQLAVLSQPLCP